MLTKKQQNLRNRLPGFRQEIMLAADKDRELVYVFVVSGFMDELNTAANFWIKHRDRTKTTTFATLNEALLAW